ncbi:MAG: hypothetical protein R3281_09615 [Balneolaceae bacterium]|nr:hypothetical protein [Balneolaceae bacterium]
MKQDHELERLIHRGTVEVLGRIGQRYHDLLALTIEERFKKFMAENAYLLQEIPRKELASYLNMDYTNFSKLMNRIRIL